MGGITESIFGGGSKPVQPPPVRPTPPTPTVDTDEVGTQARRRVPRGRQETFLTGDLTPDTGKKKRLA